MTRCPNGSRRNKSTNKCEKKKKTTVKRCPNGSRRSKSTKKCEKKRDVVAPRPQGAKAKAKVTRIQPVVVVDQPKIWCTLTQQQLRETILRMGLGKDISMKDIPTPKDPNRLCKSLGEILSAACAKGWQVTGYLGRGANGTVFDVVRKKDGRKGVVKLQYKDPHTIKEEVSEQRKLHKKGLAPELIEYCSFKPRSIGSKSERDLRNAVRSSTRAPRGHRVYLLFMDKLDGTVEDWLNRSPVSPRSMGALGRAVFDLIQRLREEGFTHGDFHIGNLGYVFTDSSKTKVRIMPIDFGWTSTKRAFTYLEVIQLVRTSHPMYNAGMPRDTLAQFVAVVRKLAEKVYAYKLPMGQSSIESHFMKEMREYVGHRKRHGYKM